MIRKTFTYTLIIIISFFFFWDKLYKETRFSDIKSLSSSNYVSWIPSFLPKNVKNIEIWTNVETDQMSMEFDLSKQNMESIERYKIGVANKKNINKFLTLFEKFTTSSDIYCYFSPESGLYLVKVKRKIDNHVSKFELLYISSKYWDNLSDVCLVSDLENNN